jgi:hypothetical protein
MSRKSTDLEYPYNSLNKSDLDETKVGNNKSETRGIQTTPHPTFPPMESFPGAYRPPTDPGEHLCLHVPYQPTTSFIAKEHGKMVFDRTLSLTDSNLPLALEAPTSIIATNSIVPESANLPFACAEIITSPMFLHFSHGGTPRKLMGDAYTQFTYFTGDSEAEKFHEMFNASPPEDFDQSRSISDAGTDGIDADSDMTNLDDASTEPHAYAPIPLFTVVPTPKYQRKSLGIVRRPRW